jgi:hypothetical protein
MTKLEITELRREDEKAWDAYVYNSSSSTFYHQLGWRNVVQKTYKHKPIYLIAKEEEFLMRSMIFGKKLVSVPFGPYGGACADNETVEKALVEEAKRITKEFDADYLELRDLTENGLGLVANSNFCSGVEWRFRKSNPIH